MDIIKHVNTVQARKNEAARECLSTKTLGTIKQVNYLCEKGWVKAMATFFSESNIIGISRASEKQYQ